MARTAVVVANRPYAKHAAVTLRSVAANSADRWTLLLLHPDNFSTSDIEACKAICSPHELILADGSEMLERSQLADLGMPSFHLLRLLGPAFLAEKGIEKALFLEADMIAECDLAELSSYPLGGHPVAATPSDDGQHCAIAVALTDCLASQDLFSIERLRDEIVHYFENLQDSPFWWLRGEGVMRAEVVFANIIGSNFAALPQRWNQSPPEVLTRNREPGILHFTGFSRPWYAWSNHPLRDAWRRHAPDFPLHSPRNVIQRIYRFLPMRMTWWLSQLAAHTGTYFHAKRIGE